MQSWWVQSGFFEIKDGKFGFRKNEFIIVGLKEGGWQGSKCGLDGFGCILFCWWLQQQLWWFCLWDVDKKVMIGLNGMFSGFF